MIKPCLNDVEITLKVWRNFDVAMLRCSDVIYGRNISRCYKDSIKRLANVCRARLQKILNRGHHWHKMSERTNWISLLFFWCIRYKSKLRNIYIRAWMLSLNYRDDNINWYTINMCLNCFKECMSVNVDSFLQDLPNIKLLEWNNSMRFSNWRPTN